MTELEKLASRYDLIRAEGGEVAFTLGDEPSAMEATAAVINAMLDYQPPAASLPAKPLP